MRHSTDGMWQPHLIGITKLMRMAFQGEDLEPITQSLLDRVHANSLDANAMLDLCVLLQLVGHTDVALEFQEQALQIQQIYRLQSVPDAACRLLVIMSRGVIMDNMPIEFLVEHHKVQVDCLYLGAGLPSPQDIPEHDVAMVAVCESDSNQDLLAHLDVIRGNWPCAMLNSPGRIACLSRERFGDLIDGIAGVTFARSQRIGREELQRVGFEHVAQRCRAGIDGLIVRPVSSHAGHGLERIGSDFELSDYLARESAAQYYLARFIDYRSRDNLYRKYRVALVDGQALPVHMAVSPRWMVHYLNADMLESASNRKEEAECFANFDTGFALKHRRALTELSQHIGLEYVVLDCAETQEGELLVFEADNGAVVHSMDPVDIFPYKRPAMDRIFDAFYSMLVRKSSRIAHRLAG